MTSLSRCSIAALFLAACTSPSGSDIDTDTDTGIESADLSPEVAQGGTTYFAAAVAVNGAQLKLVQTRVASGDDVFVTYKKLGGDVNDRIAIAVKGAANDDYVMSLRTGGSTLGTLAFHHIPAGRYEVRAYRGDSFELQCAPIDLTVQARNASLTIAKQQYTSADPIVVDFAGMSTNQLDWITVTPASAPDDESPEWYYTNGDTYGEMTFGAVPAGSYEVRAFVDGRFERVGTLAFVVNP